MELVNENFSGVVSVVRNDEILFRKAFGYRDMANKIPNKTDTKFGTASAGKVFVAAAILQLIEKGKLDLESNIGEFIDLDLKAIDRNITVRQLLNHTSGIPDYFDESIMDEYAELWHDFPNYRIRKSLDLVPLFIDKPMMYKAGEKFQYNNTGFVVLGLIIEKVTDMMFDDYLSENIFAPCGMKNTDYFELDRLPSNCANAYIFDESRNDYYTNIFSIDAKGTGAGGAFTTVTDVEQFWKNLLDGKIISHELLRKMLSVQSSDGKSFYGYGIWLDKKEDGSYDPWFTGSDPGVSFISSFYQRSKTSITIISNTGDNVWEMKNKIAKHYGS